VYHQLPKGSIVAALFFLVAKSSLDRICPTLG
jgi:hypothetical protein